MGYNMLARIGAGVNPEQMHAERVDGYNPLAVIDAYRRKLQIIKEKKGPVFLIPLLTGLVATALPMPLPIVQRKKLRHGNRKIL